MKGLLATIVIVGVIGAVCVQVFGKGLGHEIKSVIGFKDSDHATQNQSDSQQAVHNSNPDVDPFHALVADGSFKIEVRQGSTSSVTFEASPEILSRLKAEVVDGVLTIGSKDGKWDDDFGQVTAKIETPNIDGVTINGSAELNLADVKTPKLAISINGSSEVTASGTADSATFDLAGSGSVDAKQLVADAVIARIGGSGTMAVNAQKTLDASIAGSGSIHYEGRPSVTQSVAGSGSIDPEQPPHCHGRSP